MKTIIITLTDTGDSGFDMEFEEKSGQNIDLATAKSPSEKALGYMIQALERKGGVTGGEITKPDGTVVKL